VELWVQMGLFGVVSGWLWWGVVNRETQMNVRMPTTKFFGADFNDAHACPGYPVIRGYAWHISAKLCISSTKYNDPYIAENVTRERVYRWIRKTIYKHWKKNLNLKKKFVKYHNFEVKWGEPISLYEIFLPF